jgi:hypothetical protein
MTHETDSTSGPPKSFRHIDKVSITDLYAPKLALGLFETTDMAKIERRKSNVRNG